jgi:hypothetical protein
VHRFMGGEHPQKDNMSHLNTGAPECFPGRKRTRPALGGMVLGVARGRVRAVLCDGRLEQHERSRRRVSLLHQQLAAHVRRHSAVRCRQRHQLSAEVDGHGSG